MAVALRLLFWLITHTVYRIRVHGRENVPAKGPALLVCNHVSFVDAVVIAGACRRPIRFVMDHGIFKVPVLNFIFRTMRTIPIAAEKVDPKLKEQAFADVAEALRNGELVGIFPEGAITANGELQPFRPGITRILSETPVPVIPMALRGLWGSFFSRKGGPAFSKPARLLGVFRKIALVAGPPVAPVSATRASLQEIVGRMRDEWK